MNINSSLQKTPIAVIGLSSIFADAKNIEEFWTNIIEGRDSITDVPENRWKIADYYDADMTAEDKTYCKRGGFLPEIDFNPMEFGLPPNILEVTDASQLLSLIAARDAFEDAGYGRESAKFTKQVKEKTGVLLGVGGGQKLITPLIARLQYPIWEKALRASGIAEEDIPNIVDKMKKAYVGWNENSFPGLLGNVISGRITNRFDLGGINSVVDAACAASLSAIKMSLSELVEGRCDMMLTGGVDTDNSPFMYMSFSKTPAFSKSGNISPFSDKADGMLIGEGLGMLVLKRLADAERDGDRIYAVIKGVGTSSDGRFKSVYAPRPSGQALAMNRAYEDAGYSPSTVGLLEAHGTGTEAGDPTEFTSMNMVFGENNPQKQHIALGSVKSQIGHTKAAAGAAGMVKAVLALYHKVLPPSINVDQPNSKFDIKNSPIYINTESRPWIRNGHPRRAGVSAFGFGGINVHLTLEEYNKQTDTKYRLHQINKMLVLQAINPEILKKDCQNILNNLQGENGQIEFQNLIQSSEKQQLIHSNSRLGFVIQNIKECIEYLRISIQTLDNQTKEWNHPKGIYYRSQGIEESDKKVVALFSGQGSQYRGMGRELACTFPEIQKAFKKMDDLFVQNQEEPLSKAIFPIPAFSDEERKSQQDRLTQTQLTQPAIGALSIGQYKILQKAGFNPHFTAGHSFGELTAMWAAGVFDEDTFFLLAKNRGYAMASKDPNIDSGDMLAVKAPQKQVESIIAKIPGVSIANVNSNNQVVIGGSSDSILQAKNLLSKQGFSIIPLQVSAAFHTDCVKHSQIPFIDFVSKQKFNKPNIPVYSNTTGNPYPSDESELKSILKDQIINPVLFKDQIENIHKAGGRIFVEFGPKGILTNLVNDILGQKDHLAISLNPSSRNDSDLQFRQAVVQMRVLGLPLTNIDPYKRSVASLPEKTKLNVKLSANNYVSAGTQKAYQDALNDGKKVSQVRTKIVEKIVEVEKNIEATSGKNDNIQNENIEEMNKETIQLLNKTLEIFQANQAKSLDIFERIMSDQNQQVQQVINMLSQQMNSSQPLEVKNGHHSEQIENILPPLKTIHENGNGNGKSIGSNNGNGFKKDIIIPKENGTQVLSPKITTATINPPTKINSDGIEKILLEVVSEKTGYPAEMLELNMDLEADLGIDSIKRVEIFGSLTQQYPEMANINPNDLTELRTLAEIVSFVSNSDTNSSPTIPDEALQSKDIVTPNSSISVESSSENHVDSDLEKILLEVVSEKTGYPTEMLELTMDLEADLGIDSIKRVEIFGALTQQYPEMSDINPNDLTELRTLEEIIKFVGQKGGENLSTSRDLPTSQSQNESVLIEPTDNSLITDSLEKILMEVVSEKTGYPAEMLELGMDMEADLGIDSIKRVEIFGALTQQYPEMSDINPNDLTELRTLGEIVDFVADTAKKKV